MKNPFRGLRFSLLDFQAARSSTGMKIAMLGISLIPLIYGALYLMAFYDPYGKLDTLPVAVVNEDVPVETEDGTLVHAGDDLVDELEDSDALDWRFVDSVEEAQGGLEKGTYYNVVTIPADFSEKVASADSDNPQKAHLELEVNDANNYLSSILGASVMRVVTSETNYAIGENYYVQIFDQISDTGEQLQTASDGASELADGLADAHDGSQTITDNLLTARDGSTTLRDGLTDAHDGSQTITDGLKSAQDGAHQLADGTVDAADGSQKITDGLASAKDGADSLSDGLATAKDGSATITDNLKDASDGAQLLDSGLKQLVGGLSSGKMGSSQLVAGLSELQQKGSAKLASGSKGLVQALDSQKADLEKLDEGAQAVADGAKTMSTTLGGLEGKVKGMGSQIAGLQAQLDGIKKSAGEMSRALTAAGKQLQGDATQAASDASALTGAISVLEGMGGKVSDASGAAGSAAEFADKASAAATNAKGQSDAAASNASAALETLGRLSAEDDGFYKLTADQLDALKGQIGAAADAADTASTYAGEAAQDASSSSTYAAGVKEGLGAASGALSGVDSNALDTLSQHLAAVGDDLVDIQDAASSLDDVTDASDKLIESSQEAVSGASSLVDGLSGSLVKVQALATGADQVHDGVHKLVGSLKTDAVVDGTPTLYRAASQLADGAEKVDKSVVVALAGATQLDGGWQAVLDGASSAQSTGSAALAAGLGQLYAGSNALTNGLVTANTGANALRAGLGTLYAGSSTLTSGLGTAKSGSAALASGLDKLETGSGTLTDGLASAQSGSSELADGLGKLHDGSQELTDGLVKAQDGSNELADGLADGVEKVNDATSGSDERAAMMSEPVTLEQVKYTTVDNYGSGFAPYFIALGLWVGALVMTFLFKPLNQRLVMSGAHPAIAAFAGLAPWLIVGAIQSLLLGFTIQFPCGIAVAHPLAYYLLIMLASFVFCAMVQAIAALFGFPGKFVSVVLLMLQLTTAAGTFPIETEFPIFQALSPYMPMTYVVKALRQAMAGNDLSLIGPSVAALLGFFAISYGLTCLVARRKRTVTMMDLHPLVNL